MSYSFEMYWCNIFDNNLFFKCLLSFLHVSAFHWHHFHHVCQNTFGTSLGDNLFVINCVLFVWKCFYHTFIFEESFTGNGNINWWSFLSTLCNTMPLFSGFLHLLGEVSFWSYFYFFENKLYFAPLDTF